MTNTKKNPPNLENSRAIKFFLSTQTKGMEYREEVSKIGAIIGGGLQFSIDNKRLHIFVKMLNRKILENDSNKISRGEKWSEIGGCSTLNTRSITHTLRI